MPVPANMFSAALAVVRNSKPGTHANVIRYNPLLHLVTLCAGLLVPGMNLKRCGPRAAAASQNQISKLLTVMPVWVQYCDVSLFVVFFSHVLIEMYGDR
jgi:hypothetical protein